MRGRSASSLINGITQFQKLGIFLEEPFRLFYLHATLGFWRRAPLDHYFQHQMSTIKNQREPGPAHEWAAALPDEPGRENPRAETVFN